MVAEEKSPIKRAPHIPGVRMRNVSPSDVSQSARSHNEAAFSKARPKEMSNKPAGHLLASSGSTATKRLCCFYVSGGKMPPHISKKHLKPN